MDARAELVCIDLDAEPVAEPPHRTASVVLTVMICVVMVLLGAGLVGAAPPLPGHGAIVVPAGSGGAPVGVPSGVPGARGVYVGTPDGVVLVGVRGLVIPARGSGPLAPAGGGASAALPE